MKDPSLFSLNFSYWALQTVAMALTALLIPRLRITSLFGALTTVVALAFVNSKIWDAALFFQIPNSLSIHALLLFITNGVIFWILIKLLPGIEVEGFFPALIAPIVFTFCSLVISAFAPMIDWVKVFNFLIDILEHLKTYFLQDPGAQPQATPVPSG
jgi:putative membrane protein